MMTLSEAFVSEKEDGEEYVDEKEDEAIMMTTGILYECNVLIVCSVRCATEEGGRGTGNGIQ